MLPAIGSYRRDLFYGAGGCYVQEIFYKGRSHTGGGGIDRQIHRRDVPDPHGESHRIRWYELLSDGLSDLFLFIDRIHRGDPDGDFQAGGGKYRTAQLPGFSGCPSG